MPDVNINAISITCTGKKGLLRKNICVTSSIEKLDICITLT